MAVETRLITAEELEQMPPEDGRVELVRGAIVRIAPAGHRHGRIAGWLHGILAVFVSQHRLGWVYSADTGFVLSRNPDTVRAPDVAFVTRERAAQQVREDGFFDGAPDLAVEVVSPGDTVEEVGAKVLEYLRAGAKLVWVVQPRNRTVTVYRSLQDVRVLTAADSLDGADVIPGFAIVLSDLFELA